MHFAAYGKILFFTEPLHSCLPYSRNATCSHAFSILSSSSSSFLKLRFKYFSPEFAYSGLASGVIIVLLLSAQIPFLTSHKSRTDPYSTGNNYRAGTDLAYSLRVPFRYMFHCTTGKLSIFFLACRTGNVNLH